MKSPVAKGFKPLRRLADAKFIHCYKEAKAVSGGGRIPLWVVGTIAGIGALGVVGLFFYGAYVGVGSSM